MCRRCGLQIFSQQFSKEWQFSKKLWLLKKINFDHFLIGLPSPHFLVLLVFTLHFSKHGCNGGEEEEPCFAFRIIHVFIHAYEACCGHSSNAFARRVKEGYNIEFGV